MSLQLSGNPKELHELERNLFPGVKGSCRMLCIIFELKGLAIFEMLHGYLSNDFHPKARFKEIFECYIPHFE